MVQTTEKKLTYEAFENFLHYIREDPDKWNPFEAGNFLEHNNNMEFNSSYELLDIRNIVNLGKNLKLGAVTYMPILKQHYKMTSVEIKSFS